MLTDRFLTSLPSAMPQIPRPTGLAVALTLLAAACSPGEDPAPESPLELEVTPVSSGTDALLQAVSPVDAQVVWVSGHRGTWGRSDDGGATWTTGVVTGADTLQFRDVEGVDERTAILMSAGPGALSRVFRTDDGGESWTETFVMDHPEGFLDCMAFLDGERGLAYGDAVEGELYLIETTDGGRSWSRVPAELLPVALPGEGGFAASGSCVAAALTASYWIATGNGTEPRLLTSHDGGESWSWAALPLASGEGAGATTVGFRRDGRGFALGGVIAGPDATHDGEPVDDRRVALTDDGGAWRAGGPLPFEGPAYGAAWIEGWDQPGLVAVGPEGLAWSADGGERWTLADSASYWAVAFAAPEAGWAVGPGGRVARLRVRSGG
jgi:photosystem II stability/assembly factor-like uncharacterized protein